MPRILIVDDEDAIVELIEIALTQAGYACTTAMDGAAAADLIEATPYVFRAALNDPGFRRTTASLK